MVKSSCKGAMPRCLASVKGAPGHLNNGVKTKGMFPAVGDVAFPSSFDSRPNRIPGKCAPVDVIESVTV